MCGINAIYGYRESAPPVDSDELIASRECMHARGPDAGDAWLSEDGRVGFGHRRFGIIDPSPRGAPPMPRRGLPLLFNCGNFNYQEPPARPIAPGPRPPSPPPTQGPLH